MRSNYLFVNSATASPAPQKSANSSIPSSMHTVLSTSKHTASARRKIFNTSADKGIKIPESAVKPLMPERLWRWKIGTKRRRYNKKNNTLRREGVVRDGGDAKLTPIAGDRLHDERRTTSGATNVELLCAGQRDGTFRKWSVGGTQPMEGERKKSGGRKGRMKEEERAARETRAMQPQFRHDRRSAVTKITGR